MPPHFPAWGVTGGDLAGPYVGLESGRVGIRPGQMVVSGSAGPLADVPEPTAKVWHAIRSRWEALSTVGG